VHNYNQLMKDFPLNDLLAATDLPKIASSIGAIFRHISTKLKLSPYPIRRALPLVTAISRDFNDALLRVLGTGKLMFMSWDGFERVMAGLGDVFAAWDDNMKEFTGIARDRESASAETVLGLLQGEEADTSLLPSASHSQAGGEVHPDQDHACAR
jgi:dynein heavy chain 1